MSGITAGAGARLAVVLVAAVAENGVIGRAGGLPWRLKSDLKHFRAVTINHPVVMGRKTFLSIGKPLRDRTNIVVTGNPAFGAAGIVVAPSLEVGLQVAGGDALRRSVAAIMVIGGAHLYAQLIGVASRLEITRVHLRPDGDAVFPSLDETRWRETSRREHPAGPDDDATFTTLTYERRTE